MSTIDEIEKVENRSFNQKEYRYNKIQDAEHAVIFFILIIFSFNKIY